MPYRSEKQRRWAHTAAGIKALGGAEKVHEWDEASKGMKLPKQAIHSAANRIAALKSKGGRGEVRAQKKAMSKSKRVRVRRSAVPAAPMGY